MENAVTTLSYKIESEMFKDKKELLILKLPRFDC